MKFTRSGNVNGIVRTVDVRIYKRIILKYIFKKEGYEGVDFICVAQVRDQWRTVEITAM
jgi:hypothetical protein